MSITRLLVVFTVVALSLSSCVSTKKFNSAEAELTKAKNDLADCQTTLAKGQVSNKKMTEQVKDLQSQVDDLKQQVDAAKATSGNNNNDALMSTLKSLNIVNSDQAQSIQQSLQNIGTSSKDGLMNNLVSNLKGALGTDNDTDIIIQSDKGDLYIDLTDHMFFNSGSADLSAKGKAVIGKIAKILEANADMHFMVVGHTDNKPIHTGCVPDNWDLSIRRATSVIRLFQNQFKIDPKRMIAAGHGEYDPIMSNDTPEHRSQNRRISIVMTPELDQFLKLLVRK